MNGIPANLTETNVEPILEKLIENHKREAKDLDFDKNAILARSMAVNTSVKAGTRLSAEEMSDIYRRLFDCNVPEVSPDGKNVMSIVALADIEKIMKK